MKKFRRFNVPELTQVLIFVFHKTVHRLIGMVRNMTSMFCHTVRHWIKLEVIWQSLGRHWCKLVPSPNRLKQQASVNAIWDDFDELFDSRAAARILTKRLLRMCERDPRLRDLTSGRIKSENCVCVCVCVSRRWTSQSVGARMWNGLVTFVKSVT